MPGTRGWHWPRNCVLSDDDVCTHSWWHSTRPAPSASTAALPQVLQGCHLSPLPVARFDFWIFGYQSLLSIGSDSLVLDGAIESLLIIQQLLKIQVTSFVSQ